MKRVELFWGLFVVAVVLFVALFCGEPKALGYPENTRLGYANCKTCHYSPTGGGALRPYGKSTAPELSTWATGLEAQDTRFIFGGEARYLNTVTDTETDTTSRKFLMNSNLELGYEGEYLTFVFELGQYYAYPAPVYGSYKHYVQAEILNLGIRFGKFTPAFGINTEDHTLPGRNSIGFSSRDAGVNTEISYGGKHWGYSAAIIQGCQGILSDLMQKGYCGGSRWGTSGQIYFAPSKPVYLSLSGAHTETEKGATQNAYALGWVLGEKYLYSVGEITHNDAMGKASTIGWVDLLGHYRGFDLGPTFRKYQTEEVPGIKARWLPLDHFELTGAYLVYPNYNKLVATGRVYF